jgi:hypothetical protein
LSIGLFCISKGDLIMKKYAIFIDDCEIHLDLILGDLDSVDCIREELTYLMKDSPHIEAGYVEQYPFYQCDWEIVGGKLPVNFDYSQILER